MRQRREKRVEVYIVYREVSLSHFLSLLFLIGTEDSGRDLRQTQEKADCGFLFQVSGFPEGSLFLGSTPLPLGVWGSVRFVSTCSIIPRNSGDGPDTLDVPRLRSAQARDGNYRAVTVQRSDSWEQDCKDKSKFLERWKPVIRRGMDGHGGDGRGRLEGTEGIGRHVSR